MDNIVTFTALTSIPGGGTVITNVATIRKNQVVVLNKVPGQDWRVATSTLNPANTLFPRGAFRFNQAGISIENPANIGLELFGEVILKGDAYVIDNSGLLFGIPVQALDVIVALKDSPSLVNSSDWLIIENINGQIELALLIDRLSFSGNRVDADESFFINESNVVIQRNEVSSTPRRFGFVSANSDVQEIANLGSAPLQFTNLTGGSLTLEYQVSGSSTGFDPEFREIKFDYGNGIVFTFNIRNLGIDGVETVTIQIPFQDYSLALNQDPAVTLTYFERGVQFIGNLTVISLVNTNKGNITRFYNRFN